jgi:putative DNA-invertase from lambdoid prophage Rac
MAIYGYTRVSTEGQADQGVSLAAQRAAVMARGAVEVFEERGVSSGVPLSARPEGARLVALLAPGDVVVAAKLDRLFRSALECLVQVDAWSRQGVDVVLLDVGLDTSTPMGKAVLTIMAALAELERAQIRERTRAGLAQVKAEGGTVGRAPYGWRYGASAGPDGRRPLEVDPGEVAVIDRAAELRAGGLTWDAVARALNLEGSRTRMGRAWERRNTARTFGRPE